eukprot:1698517-Rhodomonas_salina.4
MSVPGIATAPVAPYSHLVAAYRRQYRAWRSASVGAYLVDYAREVGVRGRSYCWCDLAYQPAPGSSVPSSVPGIARLVLVHRESLYPICQSVRCQGLVSDTGYTCKRRSIPDIAYQAHRLA